MYDIFFESLSLIMDYRYNSMFKRLMNNKLSFILNKQSFFPKPPIKDQMTLIRGCRQKTPNFNLHLSTLIENILNIVL